MVIPEWLAANNVSYFAPAIYDTQVNPAAKLPSLEKIDVIFFSSPSTVKAFWQLFGPPPQHITVRTIGPITEAALKQL
jgi:uroporphyrinogen-III synthase